MHDDDGKPAAANIQIWQPEIKFYEASGTMNPDPSVRNAINELLRQQKLGVLSTVGKEGAPHASLVAFAVSDDHQRLFFVTPRATRKYANLCANPKVALLINNSINRPEDFNLATAVTATGTVEPLAGREREAALNRYVSRHPYLETFARSPGCELLGIRVEGYILVQRFQDITEYRVGPEMDHLP